MTETRYSLKAYPTLAEILAGQPGSRKIIPLGAIVSEQKEGESFDRALARLFPGVPPMFANCLIIDPERFIPADEE